MRRRPGGAPSLLTRCARCNTAPVLYDVRRVTVSIDGRIVQAVVCRYCDREQGQTPTSFELHAMATDTTDPIDAMRFVQQWGATAGRVQATAKHFLGADLYEDARKDAAERRAAALARLSGVYDDVDHDDYGEQFDDADDLDVQLEDDRS